MNTAKAYLSFNYDGHIDNRSALYELKTILDEIASCKNSASDNTKTGESLDQFEDAESGLDKLKHLLQLCINEFDNQQDADLSSGSSVAESPDHEQLKDLLDSSLNQLALITTDANDTGDAAKCLLVLDKLKRMLDEIINTDTTSVSLSNASTSDIQSDLAEPEDGNSESAAACTGSVLDNLEFESNQADNAPVTNDTASDSLAETEASDNTALLTDSTTVTTAETEDTGKDKGDRHITDRENVVAEIVDSALEEHIENMDCTAYVPDATVAKHAEDTTSETAPAPVPESGQAGIEPGGIEPDTPYRSVTAYENTSSCMADVPAETSLAGKDEPGRKHLVFGVMFILSAVLLSVAIYWGAPVSNDEQVETGNSAMTQAVTELPQQTGNQSPLSDSLDENNTFDAFYISLRTDEDKTSSQITDVPAYSANEGVPGASQEPPATASPARTQPARETEAHLRLNDSDNTITEHETVQPDDQQVDPVAESNTKNDASIAETISAISERMAGIEQSIADIKGDIEKTLALKAAQQENTATAIVSTDVENNQQQDKGTRNLQALSQRVSDSESQLLTLQQSVAEPREPEPVPLIDSITKHQKTDPVRPVESIASEMKAMHQSKRALGETTAQTYAIWSIYLSSYYGSPPPTDELTYLDNAGIPYKIRKTTVNDADWYRVLVYNSTEYKAAKVYAEKLETSLGIKKIWISKKKYSYE